MAFLLGGFRPGQPMQRPMGVPDQPVPGRGFGYGGGGPLPPTVLGPGGFNPVQPVGPAPFQPRPVLGSYDKLGKKKSVRIKKGGAYKLKSGKQVSGSKVKLKSLARAK